LADNAVCDGDATGVTFDGASVENLAADGRVLQQNADFTADDFGIAGIGDVCRCCMIVQLDATVLFLDDAPVFDCAGADAVGDLNADGPPVFVITGKVAVRGNDNAFTGNQ